MMFLLDTNIISYWMRGDREVINRVKNHSPSDLAFSCITLAEILYGIQKSSVKKREWRLKIQQISAQLKIYPFDEEAARAYARIRVQLEKLGTVISERDTQIAAIAVAYKLCVVTHNVREFERVAGLKVEDWV